MSEWVAIWRFAIVCVLIAFAVVFFGGCAAPAAHVVLKPVPLLIAPACEPQNIYEKCKTECLQESPSQQAVGALESATQYRCFCKPWDL